MSSPRIRQLGKRARDCILSAAIVAGLSVILTVGAAQVATAASIVASSDKPASKVDAQPGSDAMPVFKLVEGAKGSPDPYTPRVLDVPAGKKVALEITDNIGGCALVTVFPGLGADGSAVRASVPVGQTRRIVIFASKPGHYRYHCSENMFFGEIVAR